MKNSPENLPALAILLLASLCLLPACNPKRGSMSESEMAGPLSARTTEVLKLIGNPIPSKLPKDANRSMTYIGTSYFKQPDVDMFYAITVDPANIPAWCKWQCASPPFAAPPPYVAPLTPKTWWVSKSDFPHLEFYRTKTFSGCYENWIAISPATGRIYIYASDK